MNILKWLYIHLLREGRTLNGWLRLPNPYGMTTQDRNTIAMLKRHRVKYEGIT